MGLSERETDIVIGIGLALSIIESLTFFYLTYKYIQQFRPRGKQNLILHVIFYIMIGDFIVCLGNLPLQISYFTINNYQVQKEDFLCGWNGFLSFLGGTWSMYNNFIVIYMLVKGILLSEQILIRRVFVYATINFIVSLGFALKPTLSGNFKPAYPLPQVDCLEGVATSPDGQLILIFFDYPFMALFLAFVVIVIIIQVRFRYDKNRKIQQRLLILYPLILVFTWLPLFIYNILVLIAKKDPETVSSNVGFACTIYWGFFLDGILNVIYFKITDTVRQKGSIKASSLNRESLMEDYNTNNKIQPIQNKSSKKNTDKSAFSDDGSDGKLSDIGY